MKKKLIKNLEIKILSLVLAVLLWALVMNISDPEESRTIEDLPVTVINEDAIAEADKVYTIVSGDTVDITIRGPQSVVRSVSASDFTAIADLSKTSVVGAVIIDVRVSAQYEDDLTITTGRRNDAVMIISLEDKKTESFRVNVRIQDEVLENYYVMTDETRSTPNLVEVTGAVSKVDDIMEVVAEVSVQWRSASFTTQTTLKAYNSYGYEVDGLEFDTEEVEVAVSIVPTKEVEVEVVPEGIAYYGYTTERIENDPKVITIAGEQEALDKYAIFRPSFNISGWQDENGEFVGDCYIPNRNATLTAVYEKQSEHDGRTLGSAAVLEADETYQFTLPDGRVFYFRPDFSQTCRIMISVNGDFRWTLCRICGNVMETIWQSGDPIDFRAGDVFYVVPDPIPAGTEMTVKIILLSD